MWTNHAARVVGSCVHLPDGPTARAYEQVYLGPVIPRGLGVLLPAALLLDGPEYLTRGKGLRALPSRFLAQSFIGHLEYFDLSP